MGFDLRLLPTLDPWMPIDTAPKDGTRVLIVEADGTMTIVRCRIQIEDRTYWTADSWDDGHDSELEPTHWMPLPAPPPMTKFRATHEIIVPGPKGSLVIPVMMMDDLGQCNLWQYNERLREVPPMWSLVNGQLKYRDGDMPVAGTTLRPLSQGKGA